MTKEDYILKRLKASPTQLPEEAAESIVIKLAKEYNIIEDIY